MSKSIIQRSRDRCYLCGQVEKPNDPLDEHHVFFGPYKKASEKYGLKVYLHHNSCHIFGKKAVHNNAETCRNLQSDVQKIAMEHYKWDIETFIRIFGRNYIDIMPYFQNNRCVQYGDIIPEGRQICSICERTGL